MFRGSALAASGGALMGASSVRLFHDHLLVKEPGTLDRTPWHQDQPYYCIDGAQTISYWIPLDPVSRESTLEFVAGSHAEGKWYMPRSFVKKTAMVFDEGALEEVPDVEADRCLPIIGWPMEPGDAVAFNMLTLHAAAGSPTRRRVVSLRLTGDDVTWAPRPRAHLPALPGGGAGRRRAARARRLPGALGQKLTLRAMPTSRSSVSNQLCSSPSHRGGLGGGRPGQVRRLPSMSTGADPSVRGRGDLLHK